MHRKIYLLWLFIAAGPVGTLLPSQPIAHHWVTHGFEAFRLGTFGAGGANLYVSHKGTVQTIHRFDVNNDGFYDLVFSNTHDRTHVLPAYEYVFPEHSRQASQRVEYPGVGSVRVRVEDLNGDGFPELIIGRGDDNVTSVHNSWIYWGTATGWNEQFHMELLTPSIEDFCIGDFGGDGAPDFVSIAAGSGPMGASRIYRGGKYGYRFEKFTTFVTPKANSCLAADFDGDGRSDLLVTAHGSSSLIFWGSSDGLDLNHPEILPLEEVSGAARLGRRIAISTPQGPRIYSVHGHALHLDESINFPGAARLAAADLNGDGALDLVVTRPSIKGSFETTSRIFWGEKTGTIETYRGSSTTDLPTLGPADVEIGDVDGDGFPDIVFANFKDNESYNTNSYVYWGSREGYSVAHRTDLATHGADSAAIYGHDVLLSNRLNARRRGDVDSYVYLGGADGKFSPGRRVALPTVGAYEACLADLNDDGRVDVLIVNSHEDDLVGAVGSYIYWGSGDGLTPRHRTTIPSHGGIGCAVADVDRDGYLDLLVANLHNDTVSIFFGGPNGFDERREQILHVRDARFPIIADLNQDGWLDLVIPSVKEGVNIFWGSAQGYRQTNLTVLPGVGAVSEQIADLNRDGYLDIVVCNLFDEPNRAYHGVNTYIYWGSPQGYSPIRRMDLPSLGSEHATIADFNRDGFLDIFISNYQDEFSRNLDSHIYWGSRNGYSASNRTALHVGSASGSTSADFNGDGWIDLAVSNHFKNGSHITDSMVFWNGPQGFDESRKTLLPTIGAHMMTGVDQGNIYTRALKEEYTSATHETGSAARPIELSWQGTTPFDSRLVFELRGADSAANLQKSKWHNVATLTDATKKTLLSSFTANTVWQYRVLFLDGRASSPTLSQVDITFGQ